MKNPFEAVNPVRKLMPLLQTKKERREARANPLMAPQYPVIPAGWPNRQVRRALRFGRKLDPMWVVVFATNPGLRKQAMAL